MSCLEIKDLSYAYSDGDGQRVIFEDLNISFEAYRFYSILGESGCGKTTFLSIIAGLDNRYQGQVLFEGEEIKKIA